MLSLLILYSLIVSAVMCQPATTIENARLSIDEKIPDYVAKASAAWGSDPSMVAYFTLVNLERQHVMMFMEANFSHPSLEPWYNCTVHPNVTYYMANDTAVQELLCCHLRIINPLGIQKYIARLSQYLWGYQSVDVSNFEYLDALDNVSQLRSIVNMSMFVAPWKNDTRIHHLETLYIRATAAQRILAVISHVYSHWHGALMSLQTCLFYSTAQTGCAQDDLSGFTDTVSFDFSDVDGLYTGTCGASVLRNFEQTRAAMQTY